MRECLRQRPQPSLTLRCVRCGVTREIEDDGRRVHHAQVHASACTEPPGEPGQLKLVSSDQLEMHSGDGDVWFEIKRTVVTGPARAAAGLS